MQAAEHNTTAEPADFRQKQQTFYEKYGRTFEQISSQTIHSSFHPKTYHSKGDSKVTYIVKLDQLYYPANAKVIEMEISSGVTERAVGNNQSFGFGADSGQRKQPVFSINRNVIEEEDQEEEIKQVHYSQPSEKASGKATESAKSIIQFQNSHQAYDSQRKLELNTQYLNYDLDENNDQLRSSGADSRSSSDFLKGDNATVEKAKALKKHLLEKNQDMHHVSTDRKMLPSQISSHRKTKMVQSTNFQSLKGQRDNSVIGKNSYQVEKTYQSTQDDDKSCIFSDPQPLQQRKVEINGSDVNYYELSIWGCEEGIKADQCLAFQRFSLSKAFSIFKDSFFFSVDGNHLFIITVDNTDQKLTDALIFSTTDLQPNRPNQVISLRKANAYVQQLNSDLQLIPATESTSMMFFIEAGQTINILQSNGEIAFSFEQEIESTNIGESLGTIRHVGFRRISSDSSTPVINVLVLVENLKAQTKYRFKAYQLKLEDFMQLQSKQNISLPFFKLKAVNKANIKFKVKKDLANCFFKAFWQVETHLLMISIQPNPDVELIDQQEERYDSSHLILTSFKDSSKQFIAQLSTDYYRSQNLQFCKEPVLVVFNEKLNTHVGLTVEIMMTVFRKKSFSQNQFMEYLDLSHIDSHLLIKIKAEEKLSVNCFDVLFHPSKRDYSVLSYEFVEDKRLLFIQNVKGTKHFLKTSESLYLNPYFVTMDNQFLLSIYSIHSQSKVILQYKLPNQTSFLKFVEMYRGSLTISDSQGRRKDLYRHQALFILTKTSEWGTFDEVGGGLAKLNLECIEMPKYDGLNEKLETEELLIDQQQMFDLSMTSFQIYQLKSDINLDINLSNPHNISLTPLSYVDENRNIVRSLIGNVHIKPKQKGMAASIQNYLVIQSSKQLIVQQLGKDVPVKYYPFGNNFEVPMCISRLSETGTESRETLNIIYLQAVDQKYELNMLRISSNNVAESLSLTKLPQQRYLQVQCYHDQVLLLDTSAPEVTKFSYQARTQSLRKVDAFQFVDELKQVLDGYHKNQSEVRTVLTQEGIYIGPSFFQYLDTDSQDYEDIEDFEVQRAKEIGNVRKENLISGGPYLSQDSTRLFYHVTSLESLSKNKETQVQFVRQQSEIAGHVSNVFAPAKTMARTNTMNGKFQGMHFNLQRNVGGSYVGAGEDQQDNAGGEVTENYKTHAYELPLFEKKEFHILPQDEYLSQSLQFSTYVIDDLILISLNSSFLLFTKYGKSTSMVIEPQLSKLLLSNGQNLKLVQIKTINKAAATAILLEDEKKYYSLTLENKGFRMQLSLNQEGCVDKITSDAVVFQDAKFDIFGKLYHIIIQENKQKNLEVQIYERKQLKSNLSVALTQNLNRVKSNSSASSHSQQHSHKYSHEDIEHKKHKNGASDSFEDSNKKLIEHQHSHSEEDQQHDHSTQEFIFEILHDQYLLVKQGKTILFIDMRKTQNLQVQTVDVLLDGEIVSLHQTQATYLLQFVYRVCQKVDQLTYIFTWDLNINAEYSVQKVKNNRQINKIYKSIDEQLNFYIPKDKDIVYDIRYEFPLNYFSGAISNQTDLSHKNEKKAENCQELKVCSMHQSLLGICREKLASVQLSFSVMNLQYMEYMCERLLAVTNAVDFEQPPAALLQYLQFSYELNNPLHYLAFDHTFLEQYSNMVRKKVASGFSRLGLNMVSYVLMQNSQSTTPFSMTIDSKTLKNIEIMLEILCQNTNSGYDYFRYMKKYFIQLIETKSSIFFQFFDKSCTEKENLRLTTTRYDFVVKPINVTHNTRFMNKQFFREKLSADEENKAGQHMSFHNGINRPVTQYLSKVEDDPFKDPTHIEAKKNLENDVQPVQATVFDYGWLLRGSAGSEFIDFLAHQEAESPIFKLKNIKTIVNAQWKPFRTRYIKWLFIPYMFYLVCIIAFNSIMNEHIFSLSRLMQYEQDPNSYIYEYIRMPAGVLMVLFALYFLIIEFLKMKFVDYRTKSDTSIYLMITFHLLNLTTFALNFVEGKKVADEEFYGKLDPYIVFSSVSVMCAYFVFLIHLKIYGPFAFYINLIFVCLRDSFVYNIILSIGGLAFANAMFILAMIEKPDTSYDKITGVNLFTGILYQVKGYLYQEVSGVKMKNKYVFGIIYMLYTLIITQIMLKVLINLLHHFYEKANETYEQERLRTQCSLIRENEYFFGRKEMFKKVKYTIRFYAEQVNSISEKQAHGKHGGSHEAPAAADHHGSAHASPALFNAHHGHNHKKRAHHQIGGDSHEAAEDHSHSHAPKVHGEVKHKEGHKKSEVGLEIILGTIQARLESIEASVNKK